MKYLLVLVVVLVMAWVLMGRRRKRGDGDGSSGQATPHKRDAAGPAAPQQMLSCAHCGVHLPESESVANPQGQPFCSEAHRLAGPR